MSDARIVIGADGSQAMAELERLKGAFSNSMTSIQASAALATTAVGFLAAGGIAISFANSIKEAINMADHLNKLSQRTGVATESLSQLQYAAKLADLSNESLTTGLKKLNISIANGIAGDKEKVAVFKALGVTLTDTAGRTKSADKVLLDIADTFAISKDGAGKTAAAVALLGKAGDEMIPLLNGGSKAIKDLMKEADKLGLTISDDFAKKSEDFNDNLTRVKISGQKLSIALASDLVDGLGKAMKAMADATIEGGKLAGVMAGLKTLFAGDAQHKNNVALVEDTERMMALESGMSKLKIAGYTADTMAYKSQQKQLDEVNARLGTTMNTRKAFQAEEDKAKAAAAALAKIKTDGKDIKIPDKSGSDPKEKESAFAKLNKQIQEKIDLDTKSLSLGRELTEAEKFRIKVTNEMNLAKVALTAEQRKDIEASLDEYDAVFLLTAVQKSEFDQAKQIATERQRIRNAEFEQVQKFIEGERDLENVWTKSMRETLQGLADETAALSMTNAQRETAIKLREAEKLGLDKASVAYSEYAAQITAAVVKKETTDDGIKQQVGMWQTIEGAAKDTFLSIFDSGKSAFTRLKDTLKNGLYALLYEMTVKKWLISIAASVSGAGVAQQALGATSDSGGIGSLFSSASSIGSLASGAGILGAGGLGLQAGFGALINGGFAGVSAAVSGGLAAIGTGAGAGIAAGLGTIAGALGPIALGAVLVYSLLNKKGIASQSTGSLERTYDASGAITSSKSPFAVGNAGGIVDSLQEQFSALQKGLGATGGSSFGFGSYSGNDNKNPNFRLTGGSFNSGEVAQTDDAMKLAASRAVFSALSQSELPRELAGLFNGFDPAAISQEQITKVYEYGAALKSLDAGFLAGPFEQLKNISFEAAKGLIAASGSIGSLQTNLGTYFQNFYSADEQASQKKKDLTAKLNAAGVNTDGLFGGKDPRANFRALVESFGQATDATAPMIGALYSVAGVFAEMYPAATESARALSDVSTALSDTLKNLLKDRASLEADLMQAQGNTAGADAARRALAVAGYTAAENAAYDYNTALREQIKTVQDATTALSISQAAALAAAQAILGERKTLQDQLNGLTDTAVQALERQRNALNESNRALFDQVQAVISQKAATEASTAAATQAAAAQKAAAEAETQTIKASRAAALQLVTTAVNDAYAQVAKAADAQRTRLTASFQALATGINAQLSTVGTSIGKLQGLSSKLRSSLDGMKIMGSEGDSRITGQKTIADLLATARAGGGLPIDSRALDNALSAVSKPSEQLFTSFTDYARDFYRTARDIDELSQLTERGLTEQQAMQAVLEAQLGISKASYESQLSMLDADLKQVDALVNGTAATLSMVDAIKLLNSTLATLNSVKTAQSVSGVSVLPAPEKAATLQYASNKAAQNGTDYELELYLLAQSKGYSAADVDKALGLAPGASAGYISRAGLAQLSKTSAVAVPPVTTPPVTAPAVIAAQYVSNVGILPASEKDATLQYASNMARQNGTNTELELYQLAKSKGYKAEDIDRSLGFSPGAAAGFINRAGLPMLKTGTNYVPADGAYYLHQGEAVQPKQYNPAVGGSGIDTARLEALVEQLLEENRAIRASGEKTEKNTGGTQNVLMRVSRDGTSLMTTAAA